MKQLVFRYNLMLHDMTGGGINPDLSPCKVYKELDGCTAFVDSDSGMLCCYVLPEGLIHPVKYFVPTKWCEVVEL